MSAAEQWDQLLGERFGLDRADLVAEHNDVARDPHVGRERTNQ
jgi:hypothetical protein